jgi:hypothetical protein
MLNKSMGGEIKGQHNVCSKMVFGRGRFCIFGGVVLYGCLKVAVV